jgi:alkylhydroperoxidase/carboxymuconolactone decarboxylase family protein YurZ/quercetin dioxygenase-like cupin family protein
MLPPQKDFIESMAEAAGAVVQHMGDRAVYVSVMNNLSIDCDCNGHPAKPEMADVGILASLDPVALDKACVDLVYASDPATSATLRERMETRLGPHILDHAQALGYGTKSYRLVSLDGTEPPSTQRKDIPMDQPAALSPLDTAIARIGAAVARGEQDKLAAAFADAFDTGLTLAQAKELVGQLYAYCGFPRALNAAATLKTVWEGRTSPVWQEGTPPTPFAGSYDALRDGTANQTKLCGAPVSGPLFDFHPQLDQYLKAHLFGDIFARDALDWRTRELVTVAALAARPETGPQMKAHVAIANRNGVTPAQTDAILALVRRPADPAALPVDWSPIPVGEPNTAYARYFTGRSYLHKLTLDQVPAFGVTFEPACRNNWHVHHAETGGGQVLVCTAGRGYYQEWGQPAVEMLPGTTINIPAGVKHWHGAAPDAWFQHIALEVPGTATSNEWLEPVTDEAYSAAAH